MAGQGTPGGPRGGTIGGKKAGMGGGGAAFAGQAKAREPAGGRGQPAIRGWEKGRGAPGQCQRLNDWASGSRGARVAGSPVRAWMPALAAKEGRLFFETERGEKRGAGGGPRFLLSSSDRTSGAAGCPPDVLIGGKTGRRLPGPSGRESSHRSRRWSGTPDNAASPGHKRPRLRRIWYSEFYESRRVASGRATGPVIRDRRPSAIQGGTVQRAPALAGTMPAPAVLRVRCPCPSFPGGHQAPERWANNAAFNRFLILVGGCRP